MMLAALAQGQKMEGGTSEMVYNEENEQFVIKARALCFPMLLHEIVKGLYEIVGTEGFEKDWLSLAPLPTSLAPELPLFDSALRQTTGLSPLSFGLFERPGR